MLCADSRVCIYSVKEKLQTILNVDREFTEDDREKVSGKMEYPRRSRRGPLAIGSLFNTTATRDTTVQDFLIAI